MPVFYKYSLLKFFKALRATYFLAKGARENAKHAKKTFWYSKRILGIFVISFFNLINCILCVFAIRFSGFIDISPLCAFA
jgi:hypothetical protein